MDSWPLHAHKLSGCACAVCAKAARMCLRMLPVTQTVHVAISYILRAQRGSQIFTIGPKYVLYFAT